MVISNEFAVSFIVRLFALPSGSLPSPGDENNDIKPLKRENCDDVILDVKTSTKWKAKETKCQSAWDHLSRTRFIDEFGAE
jgi:hypothetical protein